MAEEALEGLAIRPDGSYVDGTAGAGGHAALIAGRLTTGRLLALDRDPLAVAMATERLAPYPQARVRQSNYGAMAEVLSELGWGLVDGILIDAGCSSMQIDTPARGFSFQEDGPLDMRMDPGSGEPASALLNRLSAPEIETLLREYGDIGPAGRIAASIKDFASRGRLATTSDLVVAVRAALPFLRETPEEVRTVFQAIRIAVNDELSGLQRALDASLDCLKPGGRLVVISFHSGEDRIVKQAFRSASRKARRLRPDGRVASETPARVRVLTPRPVTANDAECRVNPRAKSAKLRIAERLPQR
ncbi:MAG: 16S rRNA (cytosine(1402)-N(4))-methyltransferase RsmH [Candidatus Hydrogenedentes bacterium]|nr:16S rRNA (cytosine(1402)-N(4))-methyltransferase RsmH [Candidatus Hydrogenedentota bacterium]